MLECKKCGKVVKNLKLHERYAHAEAPGGGAKGGNNAQKTLVYSQLTKYICQACKGAVKEGETPCSHCGATLKWPGTEAEKDDLTYKCDGCGHQLRRGQERCPGCGEEVEWD